MHTSFRIFLVCFAFLFFLGSCKKDNALPPVSAKVNTGGTSAPVYSIRYVNMGAGQTVTYPNTLYFDLNGDGFNDISFTILHQDRYYCSDLLHDINVEIIPLNISVELATDSTNMAGKRQGILLHSRIDSALNWGNKSDMSSNYILLNGIHDNTPVGWHYNLFPSNGTGYLGIKIATGANMYYGWMRVISDYNYATMLEFAMNNTPNQFILAGQIN